MTPRDPDWSARVEAAFAAQGLMRTFRAELGEMAPGRVSLSAPIGPEASQHDGYAHAALAFALGDNACGFATLSLLSPGLTVLTVEMKINLIAPAKGERLIAEGRVERPGRTLTVARAEVFAEAAGQRTAVALLQGTMIAAVV